MATLGVYYNVTDMGFFCARTLSLKFLKLKKTKILKHSNNFAVMAILGDFGEFEGPVPEPPYSYHQKEECQPCAKNYSNAITGSKSSADCKRKKKFRLLVSSPLHQTF